MSLFQQGSFILSSGLESDFKIDCDYLTDEDIECCAYLLAQKVMPFEYIEGVPTGGIRLAKALEKYKDSSARRLLIVDDVYTTGASMEKLYKQFDYFLGKEKIGAVIFNRANAIAPWVTPLFTMHS